MVDPLEEVVSLLQPSSPSSKLVSGAGRWSVRRSEAGKPGYCVILEGACRLGVDGRAPVILEKGDFALVPSTFDFTLSSVVAPTGKRPSSHVKLPSGEIRWGIPHGPPEVRMLVGYCIFASPDAGLLVSLLPQFIHVRGEQRLSALVEFVREESGEQRPARAAILRHLLEVLFIEALRSSGSAGASPGLVRGLADERIAVAIRRMHESPSKPWTVVQLARAAALSRSTFFERFTRVVGVAPMEYLLGWRMALAKGLLQRNEINVAEVAEQVGYGSASGFSVAFSRYVGMPPGHYARAQGKPPDQ